MNRLQYTNFGTIEKPWMGNFVTDVDGNDTAGCAGSNLRKSGGGLDACIRREPTPPTPTIAGWRGAPWTQSGNFAIAYNVSSSRRPSPACATPADSFDDPLGVLTQTETVIHAGTASNSSNRYGDYSR